MLVRNIKCPACQAPLEVTGTSETYTCEYCGAIVYADARDTALIEKRSRVAAKIAAAARADPQSAEALGKRLQSLQANKEAAAKRGDREAWRKVAVKAVLVGEEYSAAMGVGGAGSGGLPSYEERLAAAGHAADAEAIQVFDPVVRNALDRMYKAGEALNCSRKGSLVKLSRNYLDAVLDYFRKLYGHPDYPGESRVNDDELRGLAESYVRSSLVGLEGTHRAAEAREALAVVLGEVQADGEGNTPGATTAAAPDVRAKARARQQGAQCANCGMPLTPADLEVGRCPSCGGRVQLDSEDAWLDRLVARYRPMAKQGGYDSLRMFAYELFGKTGLKKPPTLEQTLHLLADLYGYLKSAKVAKVLKEMEPAAARRNRALLRSVCKELAQGWPEPN